MNHLIVYGSSPKPGGGVEKKANNLLLELLEEEVNERSLLGPPLAPIPRLAHAQLGQPIPHLTALSVLRTMGILSSHGKPPRATAQHYSCAI